MATPISIRLPRSVWRMWARTYRRDLPASWTEVDEARRLSLLQILIESPGLVGQVKALRMLLDLPKRIWRRLDAEMVAALLEKCPWLISKPDPRPTFPSFNHNGVTYYLPAAHGLNLVALEYPIADEALLQFAKKGEGLLLLCGTLCREAEPDQEAATRRGDKRRPLRTRYEAEARAKRLEGLPIHIQIGVLMYFAGVKEYVHKAYGKHLFEQPEDKEPGQPSTTPSLGWWSIYFSLGVEGPFGNLEQVYQTEFHDVCVFLVDRIKAQKAEAMKARLQSNDFGVTS